MNLITRVFFMSMCVFTAYALPRLSNMGLQEENVMLRAVISQLQNAMAIPKAAENSSQDVCTLAYSKRVNDINIATVDETQNCYKKAMNASLEFDRQVLNYTVQQVNVYSQNLQDTLKNCSNEKSNEAVLNCYASNFDKNLGNLYNLTIQSEIAVGSVPEYEWQVDVATKFCVDKVLVESRTNLTDASHKLQVCLNNSEIPKVNHTMSGSQSKSQYEN